MIVVLYHHRHGIDVWLAPTMQQAKLSAANAALDYIEEVDLPVQLQFLEAVIKGRYDEAINLYGQEAREEFEFFERTPQTFDEAGLKRAARKKVLEIGEEP